MSDHSTAFDSAAAGVIGSILLRPTIAGDVFLRLREEDFPEGKLRAIFSAMRRLHGEQKPIDAVLLMDMLGDGFSSAITDCMDATPTAANYEHYCDACRKHSELRELHAAAMAALHTDDLDEARGIFAAAGSSAARPDLRIVSITEMMAGFYRRYAGAPPEYLEWGLGMLDNTLQTTAGQYILIGARPSTGKTALAFQLGLNIARKKKVGFFSLETGERIAADRLAANRLDLTLPQIKRGQPTQAELAVTATQIGKDEALRSDFHFISASSLTVADIRAISLAQKFDVIFIDYVQLIRPTTRADRTEQMQRVSMDLRELAQMTGIVVVGLAQLRRPDGQAARKAATMADLKESGQFEQDADAILLLYLDDPNSRSSDRWLKIEKNKEGEAGLRARYRFDGPHQKFIPVMDSGRGLGKPKFEEIGEEEQMALPF